MTAINFYCPNCGKELSAKAELAGKERVCPKCRMKVTVPRESQPKREADGPEHEPADHPMMLLSKGQAHPEDLIDMTAMVDIVFFLLIFFMVTSIQALESVIGLPTPQTNAAAPSTQVAPDYANDPSFVTVTIEADDTVWVEDEQVFGPQGLRVKLRDLRDSGFQPTGMLVEGNPEASHGTLVMVLDAGADVGMEELKFSVTGEGGESGG